MTLTDNPVIDAERVQHMRAKNRPKCSCCGEPIFEEKAIYYDCEWWCDDCKYEFLNNFMEAVRHDD